jgi:hypothetical protein
VGPTIADCPVRASMRKSRLPSMTTIASSNTPISSLTPE